MKKFILSVSIVLAFTYANAQKSVTYDKEKGIETLEYEHQSAWEQIEHVEGFRIQLTAAAGVNSQSSVQKVCDEFKAQFPNIPTYITFAEPYFRLRVGDFQTKLDAVNALKRIQAIYPGAYIIKDEINFK